MNKAIYVRFETPKEIQDKVYETVEMANASGSVKKGTNEVTKVIERNTAKLVVIAEDIQPPEVVAHIPLLCEEKDIPYLYVASKTELGKTIGIKTAASIGITDAGKAKDILKILVDDFKALKKSVK